MNAHRDIQRLLYDYVADDLPPDERRRMEEHLRACDACQESLRRMERTFAILQRPVGRPSDERPPQYWTSLAASVMRRLEEFPETRHSPANPLTEWFRFVTTTPRRALLAAGGGTLALAVLALLLFSRPSPPPAASSAQEPVAGRDAVSAGEEDLSRYLRQSRTLIVGLSNMETPARAPLDLTAERKASRRLIEENRRLRQLTLDPGSAVLLEDIEKIMLKVANTRDDVRPADVEMIRGGIRQQNLLFKIRMAENTHRAQEIMTVSERH